jgi:adrenodoxin-NADP+ reductase
MIKRIAIIGSGPAGFYTAQYLLKHSTVSITMFEKRMFPFGLIRYGVAPDHFQVKNTIKKYESLLQNPGLQFVGGVKVGRDVDVKSLLQNFHAVVIACGSNNEKQLGLENESAGNVFSSREFVGWYNGDTDTPIDPNLDVSEAVIIGNGNVALDCARILLKSAEELASTDITSNALSALKQSKIKKVSVIGRRGLMEASFTSKELRELVNLKNVHVRASINLADYIRDNKASLMANRAKKRISEILANSPSFQNEEKILDLVFLRSPSKIHVEADSIRQLELTVNDLQGGKAVPTSARETIPCGLLIKSIGYMNSPIEGVPFDTINGLIPNMNGRVVDSQNVAIKGLYTSGWIKTGPVGVLTSTLFDSNQTAQSILEDMHSFKDVKIGLEGLNLANYISYRDYQKLDAEELSRGSELNKPREKLTDLNEIMKILSKES